MKLYTYIYLGISVASLPRNPKGLLFVGSAETTLTLNKRHALGLFLAEVSTLGWICGGIYGPKKYLILKPGYTRVSLCNGRDAPHVLIETPSKPHS